MDASVQKEKGFFEFLLAFLSNIFVFNIVCAIILTADGLIRTNIGSFKKLKL